MNCTIPILTGIVICTSFAAQADETIVTLETDLGRIDATLHTPTGDPAPVVLLLHGFTGSRDELPIPSVDEGVFTRTARLLGEAGYASLRIDFRGSGTSGGDWADTTFSGQIADAVAAIDWLQDQESVDGDRLAVLGWSQGGLVAAHAAAQAADHVDSLILWNPVTVPVGNYTNIFGAEPLFEAIAADADDLVTLTLPWGVETDLRGGFFDEMLTTGTAGAVAQFDGPMQVFMGTQDTVITPQPGAGEMLIAYHEGIEELHVFEMDHVFNVFTDTQTLDRQMMPEVLRWLESTL